MGERVADAGVDGVFDGDGGGAVGGDHALEQVEGLLAAGGDEDVVAGAGHAGVAGLFEEVLAEGDVALRGAELEDLGDFGGVEDFEAGLAEGFDGEEGGGGA